MSSVEPLLDRPRLMEAFRVMDELLAQRGLVCSVYVFGGAAMVLAFDERQSTRDVDSRYTSTAAVEEVVGEVARRLRLPRSWLNEQATVYLPRERDASATTVYDTRNLRVSRASARHLLAMKAAAARRHRDLEDIALLAGAVGITTVEGVVAVHDQVLPDDPLDGERIARIQEALQR